MANQPNNSNNSSHNSNTTSTSTTSLSSSTTASTGHQTSSSNNSTNTNSSSQTSSSSSSSFNNTSNINTQQLSLVNQNNNNTILLSSVSLLNTMPGLTAAAVAAGLNSSYNGNNNDLQNANNSSNTSNLSNLLNNQITNIAIPITSLNNTNNGNNNLNSSNTNTGFLDLIMCKLVAPFHVVNDPRLLECGSSACYQCIISTKDNERNLKCPYCNNVHKIPMDVNKLIVNKNLQNFLKINLKQINQSFSKHLEDSMFALEQKIHSQNLSMENFDQYLTLIQNDVQMKIDTMKNHLEKYGEQFIENLKLIRKEVQKQWIEHTSNNPTTSSILNETASQVNINQSHLNQNQLASHLQQASIGKDKPFHIIGLKSDIQSNLNVLAVLNNTNANSNTTYQLNTFPTSTSTLNNNSSNNQINSNNTTNLSSLNQQNEKQRNSQNNSLINNSNKTTLLQHNDNLNTSLDALQNTFNFSNSSSWHANDDDLEDFDTDINLKPVPTSGSSSGNGQKRHLNKEQAQFNKFVREEVSKKFGDDFLLQHEVNQLESSIMELIKTEAIASFLPKDTTPARAWTLAKVSLRSLKRDLRRKQAKGLVLMNNFNRS